MVCVFHSSVHVMWHIYISYIGSSRGRATYWARLGGRPASLAASTAPRTRSSHRRRPRRSKQSDRDGTRLKKIAPARCWAMWPTRPNGPSRSPEASWPLALRESRSRSTLARSARRSTGDGLRRGAGSGGGLDQGI
jgi:hypothetical protein